MEHIYSKRTYSDEEKRQLIANLDIEVAHRSRQFEAWLADRLENFTIHQEGQVCRIPKQVRGMTMRQFGEKYNGNIQSALRGFQAERLTAAGADATLGEIDKSMRKRKWVESQETEDTSSLNHLKGSDSQKVLKNARTKLTSPQKIPGSSTGPGTAQRSRLLSGATKTFGTSKTMGRPPSLSPQKGKAPFSNSSTLMRPPSRPTSPVKGSTTTSIPTHSQLRRVPSSLGFNPTLPPKTPIYPAPIVRTVNQANSTMRLPRKDENMLSINGSPLVNPYEFGLGWFKGVETNHMEIEDEKSMDVTRELNQERTLKRAKSSIIIRRDPSVAFPSLHSRTDSQASYYTASSSQTGSSSHSRENSETSPPEPQTNMESFRFPSSHPKSEATPRPLPSSRSLSALVAIPTKDGHLLEFDPLQTSPGALDALEGISDSAKKLAKSEMGRLIQATADKWRIR